MNASSIKAYGSQMQIRINPSLKIVPVMLIPILLTMTQNLIQETKAGNDNIREKIGMYLKSIAKSSHIKINLIPADLYFRTNIDATRIDKYSCEFTNINKETDIPARIAALIEENIRSATDGRRLSDDFRGSIKSGGAVVYLDRLTNSGTITGKIGTYYITLNDSFLDSLFNLINKSNFSIVSNAEINSRYNCSFNRSLYSG